MVAALPVLAALAFYVRPLRLADAHVLDWLSSHKYTPAYEYTAIGRVAKAIIFFAEPLPMLTIVILGCVWAIHRERSLDALAAVTVVGGANLTTQVLKHLFAHARDESFLKHSPDLTTFPSGHVTSAASMVIALVWVASPARRRIVSRLGLSYLVMAGFAVLVLEWHFPSDVVGAFCVTGAWAFAVLAVYLVLSTRRGRRGRPGESPRGARYRGRATIRRRTGSRSGPSPETGSENDHIPARGR